MSEKTKIFKIIVVFGIVFLFTLIVFVKRYNGKENSEVKFGDVVAYHLTNNLVIKTSAGDIVAKPFSDNNVVKNIGTFPFDYQPDKLILSLQDKAVNVDKVEFILYMNDKPIIKSKIDDHVVENVYDIVTRKNEVRVLIEKITPKNDISIPRKITVEKQDLNPSLSKLVSEKTLMNCYVEFASSNNNYEVVFCENNNIASSSPPVLIVNYLNKKNPDLDGELRAFTISTKVEELGVIVNFKVNQADVKNWKEIHSKIFELIKIWNVSPTLKN